MSGLVKSLVLPKWVRAKSGPEAVEAIKHGGICWTNEVDPPPIGAVVWVRMNALGWATVIEYGVLDGYLGLMVRTHKQPEWHKRQSPENTPGLVFGAEVEFAARPFVFSRELSTFKMVGVNEKLYQVVISKGIKKRWVGFGWVEEGPATEEDRIYFPEVAEN